MTDDEDVLMSSASGVSDNGSVVVGKAYLDSYVQAFRFTTADGLQGIGDLPGGIASSDARAVSRDGLVVVGTSDSDLGTEAFLWTSGSGMMGLGALPGTFFGSQALAVSANGSVVVGSSLSGAGNRAFIWDAVNGMRNLADVLVAEAGVDLTGWTLNEATGISDDGTVIVGNGVNPSGQFEGFIATFGCAAGLLAGRVDTGDGSPSFDVFTVNGSSGDECREVTVIAGREVIIEIANAPSITGAGHYALWVYDGAPVPGGARPILLLTRRGVLYDLGLGPRCLPVSNTLAPGACPCPLTFPTGRTSKSIGLDRAARLCLNSRPALPRSPVTFVQTFPAGDFTLGGVVLDRNSMLSPRKNASIGNWIVIHSR